MSPSEVPPPPALLDLGDLSSLKVGDEVVAVRLSKGVVQVTDVRVVAQILPDKIRTRPPNKPITIGAYRHDGRTLTPPMYGDPHYLSANPKHIKASKRQSVARAKVEAKKKAIFEAKYKLALPIARELSNEEVSGVAEELATKLHTNQLKILSEWLNL